MRFLPFSPKSSSKPHGGFGMLHFHPLRRPFLGNLGPVRRSGRFSRLQFERRRHLIFKLGSS
ncbi:hypothetical protein AALP_AA7G094600 [Arabis alpina]|uniref:Uncharacterized protein n=1 Tax=Arabis alpina TaxID=50452 RepID=A0A087GGZ2_ARAAL|nr:hypothetical protein AALP_AA7G094600 [Arabis alpina]